MGDLWLARLVKNAPDYGIQMDYINVKGDLWRYGFTNNRVHAAVEAIVHELAHAATIAGTKLHIHKSVSSVVAARIKRLPARRRDMQEVLAVACEFEWFEQMHQRLRWRPDEFLVVHDAAAKLSFYRESEFEALVTRYRKTARTAARVDWVQGALVRIAAAEHAS